MKRNFNNEPIINVLLRALRATLGRIRGKLFYFFSFFSKGSSSKIYLGKGVRLINSKSILLKGGVSFGIRTRLECYNQKNDTQIKISVGENTSFGDYLHIGSMNNISIGSNVLGGSNILIIDHNHGSPKHDMMSKSDIPPRQRKITSKGPIIVEDNVWIGDNVVILANSKIGKGAIVAAGSIVNQNIDAYTIYSSLPKLKK